MREMEEVVAGLDGRRPTLLLHSCCAPCSSGVLERLAEWFDVTVFYYNPNISPEEEYMHRVEEVKRLLAEMRLPNPVRFLEGKYDPERFLEAARGLENVPEGGERCEKCFRLRLSEAARVAAEGDYDYFTTTLTISPMKNAALLNRIGREEGSEFDITWLPSDFKKKNGYQHSIEMSRKYGLYRQDFCGCVFSQREAEARRQRKALQEPEKDAAEMTRTKTSEENEDEDRL